MLAGLVIDPQRYGVASTAELLHTIISNCCLAERKQFDTATVCPRPGLHQGIEGQCPSAIPDVG